LSPRWRNFVYRHIRHGGDWKLFDRRRWYPRNLLN
jgi:hypothetical protein